MAEDIESQCESMAARLTKIGRGLWDVGWMLGPDRVSGKSSNMGDERVVAAGLVIETAADAANACVLLMRNGRFYSAAALTRNIIECEYLLTLFVNDRETAREWMHADEDALRTRWAPKAMRSRSGGAFRDTEYWSHSSVSGHPTPAARLLLHAPEADSWWSELHLHIERIMARVEQVTKAFGYDSLLGRDA